MSQVNEIGLTQYDVDHAADTITDCPNGATDLDSLCQLIAAGNHDLSPLFAGDLARFLEENPRPFAGVSTFDPADWDWDDIRSLVAAGFVTDEELDDMIHRELAVAPFRRGGLRGLPD
jgi:hypothetical protein